MNRKPREISQSGQLRGTVSWDLHDCHSTETEHEKKPLKKKKAVFERKSNMQGILVILYHF